MVQNNIILKNRLIIMNGQIGFTLSQYLSPCRQRCLKIGDIFRPKLTLYCRIDTVVLTLRYAYGQLPCKSSPINRPIHASVY